MGRRSAALLLRRLDDFLVAGLFVAFADLMLFHSGGYYPLLQPESYSGQVERQIRRLELSFATYPVRKRIVLMGNSWTGAGIQESQLEEQLAESGFRYHALNVAIGGSSPLSWYLLLDNGFVSADNTEIVVLGINRWSIQALGESRQDLKISKTRLRIADIFAVAASFSGLEQRLEVSSSIIFRTPLFRDDLRQYLEDPRLRHRQLAAQRRSTEAGERAGKRRENVSTRDLVSARLGKDGRLVVDELAPFLQGRSKGQLRARIERLLRHRKDFLEGRRADGRSAPIDLGKVKVLERLTERLNAKGVRVVLSIIPRSPYPLNALAVSEIDHLVKTLARRGADIALWHDAAMIRRLESPEYFRDPQHLNAAGAAIYTRGLARFLARMLDSRLEVEERLEAVGLKRAVVQTGVARIAARCADGQASKRAKKPRNARQKPGHSLTGDPVAASVEERSSGRANPGADARLKTGSRGTARGCRA